MGGALVPGLQAVAGVFGQIAEEERQKADFAAITDAEGQLDALENRMLNDPEKGALHRRGKDAMGLHEEVIPQFNSEAERIERSLGTDGQRLIFKRKRQQRQGYLERRLNEHEFGERERYYDGLDSSTIESSRENAAGNYSDPERVGAELERQRQSLDAHAARKGWSPEQLDRAKRDAASKTHLSVLEAAIAAGNQIYAEEYLNARKSEMNHDDQLRAGKLVQQSGEGTTIDKNVGRILDIYERQGIEAGQQALSALSDSDLPPLMRDEIRGKVNGAISRLREQRRQEHADDLATIDRSIAAGTADRETLIHVDRLYELGVYSPEQRANALAAIERGFTERSKRDAVAQEVRSALNAGLPLDPSNIDHRKALSDLFTADAKPFRVGSPEWRAAASAYAARTRMLPEQAAAWIRQAIRSPEPRLAADGAQFYGAIAAASPDALSRLDEDTKAFAATVSGMIEAGTDPTRAVETARATVFDLKPEVRERRITEYREHAKHSDAALSNLVDRDFDPSLFASPPALSAGIAADFASQSERYFQKVGDIALARDLAWADVKRIYGPSRINGEQIMMAFPPERFGVQPEEVRADIRAFLESNPQVDGSATEDIVLVPDSITLRQVGNALNGRPVQPSYKLTTRSGDLVLDQHGIPKRYTLPSGAELAQRFKNAEAKAAAEAQTLVDQARRDREQRQRDAHTYRGFSGPGVMR